MGLKRIPPTWWVRIKAGRKVGFAAFVIVTGLASAIITSVSATQMRVPWKVIIFIGLICVAIGIIASYLKGRVTILPFALIDEMSSDGIYVCRFCSEESLREACELTRPFYGSEYVEADIAIGWLRQNPKAFIEILNADGELCSCFGILAITDSFMEQFVKGRLSDIQLRGEDICNHPDSKKCNRLYISGVIVREHSTHKGRKRANVMIWAMLMYVKSVYGLRRKRELFAVTVTKESELLMKNLGFKMACEGRNRTDKCNLYSYELTKDSWVSLIAKVGDWSAMCKCDFN